VQRLGEILRVNRWRRRRRGQRGRASLRIGALAAAALAAVVLLDGAVIEPRLLFEDRPVLDLGGKRLRIAHLSDLHVRGDSPLLHRLAREVAAAHPDFIVVSGDLIHDVPDRRAAERIAAATEALLAALRRTAPVYLVQGHSEHEGALIPRFAHAGAEWLSNEGRLVGPRHDVLLLGLNTQVGVDAGGWSFPSPFRTVEVDGLRRYGAERALPYRNFYSHYDPRPASLADTSGPLAWSGYDTTCDVRVSDRDTAVGLAVHSRYVVGEDRMIELHRDQSRWSPAGSFTLILHGSGFTGGARDHLDTGVDPKPGRWYRLRLRTEVEPERVRAFAKAWPISEEEPARWQAWGEDRSPFRLTSGTVGLGASGGGTVAYRELRVVDRSGQTLLDDPLFPREPPAPFTRAPVQPEGFRVGPRATRLALALARSPQVPAGTPIVVVSHVPDAVLEASQRGLDAVLAGHTHGGQVVLPFFGPLTVRCALGPFYAHGLFLFAAPNPRGLTKLYVNSGVGMSVLPIRFACPPRWALVRTR
jgi:predicted MPP superfamily phosphohydrolase